MEDKIKVKDLATEMGMSTKDLTRVLRELEIEVKSPASNLTADMVTKVKARMQPEAAERDEVMRKEIQPGVIVRRRKVRENEAEPDAQEAPDGVQLGQKAPAGESGSADSAPAQTEASVEAGKPKATESKQAQKLPSEKVEPEAQASAAPQDSADKGSHARVVTPPAARIVTPKAEALKHAEAESGSAEAHSEAVPTAPVAVQAEEASAVASEQAQSAPVPSAGEKDAGSENAAASAQESKAERAPRKKSKAVKVETPPARIVRMPEPEPVVVAEPVVAPAPAVVESPSGAAAQASEAAPAESAAALNAEGAEQRSERRRAQPAASASPEGSSQPSLLPPVSESRRQPSEEGDDEDRKPHARRRPPENPMPQVRVISRPDPNAFRPAERVADRPAGGPDQRGGYRPGQQDNRPPHAGAPGANPGGYQGQRPGGPRPGGPRPAQPGTGNPGYNNAGPGNAGPGRPAAPFTPAFGQPIMGEATGDQSRKKRNKGRRTVDFPQSGGNADFGRRRADEDEGQVRSRSRGRKPKKMILPQSTQPMKAAKRKLRVEEAIRVGDMAHQMGLKSSEIIKILFNLGIMATINNALDIDTATLVAAEFDYEIEKVGFSEDTYLVPVTGDAPGELMTRPPVVTIMGHVDHGKTSLLDAIRKTNVTGGEAGGITQHIGAYHVTTKRGEIVFLDTPGHEAFTSMRARGAQVTDLVVLVVAADDGVMEQTREAINHSRAAGVPIMVAVNKIDKEAANPDRVLRELAELGLQAESWGGDVVVSMVSAKTRQGLDDLLELIALQAEVLELKANPNKPARGHIVEAKLDKGRGPVATVLIQEGTLNQGDAFVCGVFSGRVRALFNDQGRKVKSAGPSMPVEVQGFEGVPEAGEEFVSLTDEKAARRIAEARAVKQRERELAKESRVTLETFLSRRVDAQEALVLNLVLKADVQGSLEAITEALRKLSTEKVRIEIIHGGAGSISETDIMLAAASDAIIIGFNVRPTAKVKEVAEQEHVDIRFYDIIYKLVEEIKSAMAGMLAPVKREVYLGQAEVRDIFPVPKVGNVAGCHVSDGKVTRNAGVRLLRNGVVIYTGKITSLRRFKDDMKEVLKGYECGMGLENYNDIKIGDIIEAFETVEEAAVL